MTENWANSRHFIRLTGFLTIGTPAVVSHTPPAGRPILIAIAR